MSPSEPRHPAANLDTHNMEAASQSTEVKVKESSPQTKSATEAFIPLQVREASSSSVFPDISLGFTILCEIFVYVTFFFFNPTREIVTFRLRGWCVLVAFLLLAFTCLGHECQDLLSLCDGTCIHRLLTYAYLSRWSIGHQRPLAIALCSGLLLSFWTSPLLFQLCFSVSPPTVARLASLPLPLQVPGQGLACGAGCWLPEGVSNPAPLPPQYLLSHWFLSRSLPQIFISDLLLPLDFVDAPQTGVEECLDLSLHGLLSAMSHIHKAGLTSHWSWRCWVWFSWWFLQMPRCFYAWWNLLLPCWFWLWCLGLYLPVGQPHFPGRWKTPPPLWVLHQLWLVHWQLCSSSSAQSSFC